MNGVLMLGSTMLIQPNQDDMMLNFGPCTRPELLIRASLQSNLQYRRIEGVLSLSHMLL